jgi:uncharacterized damage-inducible protein DinB
MTEIDRILKHYDGVLSGDAWHGDSVWKVLADITAETAAARPVSGAHSIWEIVAHMTFWVGVVLQRLHGKRAGLVEELNFPKAPEPTEENWRKTLEEFRNSNRLFGEALANLNPAKLNDVTAAGKRTYYGEAHGILEHHVYHLGQIALLKKSQN